MYIEYKFWFCFFRLCFRQLLKAETDKERLLTAYQINEDVVSGKFPLSKELSLELAVLMAQVSNHMCFQCKSR